MKSEMKRLVLLIMPLVLAVLFALPLLAQAPKAVKVKPYVKKNGTVVQPHVRTSPNKTKTDNYSTKGNVNPMTGKRGTVDPDKPPKPKAR